MSSNILYGDHLESQVLYHAVQMSILYAYRLSILLKRGTRLNLSSLITTHKTIAVAAYSVKFHSTVLSQPT